MNKCYGDVKAFMLLGQPDMVSAEPRTPDPSGGDVELRPLYSELLVPLSDRMVQASKTIRTAGPPTPTRLGLGLMLEELGEAIQAALAGDLPEFADGLADLAYVTIWTALAHGIDLPEVWAEVQRSNMEKFPECKACEGAGWTTQHAGEQEYTPKCSTCSGLGRVVTRDASGKVQKPMGWTPPDIKGVLARQRGA